MQVVSSASVISSRPDDHVALASQQRLGVQHQKQNQETEMHKAVSYVML